MWGDGRVRLGVSELGWGVWEVGGAVKEGNRRAEEKRLVAGCIWGGCILGRNLIGREGDWICQTQN